MAKKTNADRQENAFQAMIWPVLVLVIICIACSAALAALNKVTAPVIEENTRIRTLESYVAVLPEGTSADSLTELTVSEASLSAGVTGAVSAPDGSIAVQAAAAFVADCIRATPEGADERLGVWLESALPMLAGR